MGTDWQKRYEIAVGVLRSRKIPKVSEYGSSYRLLKSVSPHCLLILAAPLRNSEKNAAKLYFIR